jgi:hypothetical protein
MDIGQPGGKFELDLDTPCQGADSMVSFTAAVPLANAILTACIQAMSPRMSHVSIQTGKTAPL